MHDFIEEHYLDYLEDVLDPCERSEFDEHLANCSECREAFKQYRALYLLEVGNDLSIPVLDDSFADDVMCAIQVEEIPESFRVRSRRLISSLVVTNVVLGLILVAMIGNRGSMLELPKAKSKSEMALAALPEGYQRVSLNLDPAVNSKNLRTGEPTFVDVRVAYQVQGTTRIAEVLRFAKVEGVYENQNDPSGQAVLNVLVKNEDAERVKLARILGDLSVLMFSTGSGDAEILQDPEGRRVEAASSALRNAVLYQTPENTQIPVRKIFDQGSWREDPGIELLAF
jgi:hypothetical protein